MPSGGDTGSIASSLLPRADVLFGSGDLSGERSPPRSEFSALSSKMTQGFHSPPNPALLYVGAQPLFLQRAGGLLFQALGTTRGLHCRFFF